MGLEYPCVYYKPGGLCEKYSTDGITSYCVQGPCPDQSLSNSDRIRAMGDEELATMLNRFAEGEDAPHYCRNLPECNTDKMCIRDRHYLYEQEALLAEMQAAKEGVLAHE